MIGYGAVSVLNVTVTNTTASSFLAIGFDLPQPHTSNLNWVAGQTVANLVQVRVANRAIVDIYNAAGYTDVIVDVLGYFCGAADSYPYGNCPPGTPEPSRLYQPLVPSRILDTRDGTGGYRAPVNAGQSVNLQVTSSSGPVPVSGAAAVVLNVTATNPTARSSYLTVYPTGATRPNTSNLNFRAGQTVANRVTVKLGTGGQVSIFNPAGSVDVVVDLNGWFTDASNPAATGSLFNAVAPARIVDTRDGTGGFSSRLGPPPDGQSSTIALMVAGIGGVPAMTAPMPPRAVVLNLTVTGPAGYSSTGPKPYSSFLTVWPHGQAQPISSDLNFLAGQTRTNLVVVEVGANGQIDIHNAAGAVHVIADVLGWYG